ncbi:MAG: reverse gyrase [Vulcanisaeta sp. AZ3]|jgi:reverse gyrase
MEKQPLVIYRKVCPNCGGDITSDRLNSGLPCHKCLPENLSNVAGVIEVLNLLERLGTINRLRTLSNLIHEYEEFSDMFKSAIGMSMWGAQRLWARRLIKGKSFAVVAPTGSGKTTFGIIASIYMVVRRTGKVLIMVPTSTLAYDIHRRLVNYANKLGVSVKVVHVSSILSKQELSEAMKSVEDGDFDILIITNAFLPRHMDLLKRYRFSLIFVDDVDSVLRASSRNIDRLLILLGISEETLHKALEVVELIKKLRRAIRFRLSEEEINSLRRDIEKLSGELRNYINNNKIGILIASGALTKIRKTTRLFLFREFLGFETGGRAEGLRNVVDVYVKLDKSIIDTAVQIVKRLSGGGIVYVPSDLKDLINELDKKLNESGIKSAPYLRPSKSVLNDFIDGKIDVLIGLATPRSSLVRGIDLPQRIAYVVFIGVPRMRFRVKLDEFTPIRYLMLLFNIRNAVPQYLRNDIDRVVAKLKNLTVLNQEQINNLLKAIKENKELSGFEKYAVDVIKEAVDLVNKLLSDKNVRKAIEQSSEVGLEYINNELYVVVPDVTTYVQGSGRTSRFYVGGVSKGLSVLIIDNEKIFNGLTRNLKYRLEDVRFQEISEVNLDNLIKNIKEERELIRNIMLGKIPNQFLGKDPLRTAFVIVESPTKARTIASFFGVPTRREVGPLIIYEAVLGNLYLLITATKGHMWDLMPSVPLDVKDFAPILGASKLLDYYGVLKVNDNFIPIYSTIKRCPVGGETYTEDSDVCKIHDVKLVDVMEVVNAIRDVATEVDQVMIGTDPDSEGEKIAWDVYMILRPYVSNIYRIEFHEVTKKAIIDAITNPRGINTNMVNAQLIRRIEDRWIGFGLSQKVQEEFHRKNLSAGRVQTPVLGWIIDRFDVSRKDKVYTVTLTLNNNIKVRLSIPPEKEDLIKVLRALHRNKPVEPTIKVKVNKISEEKGIELNPPPPYTTDALLRDAANILGLSVERTMAIAQELFESGLITYHRTDSTRVSTVGIGIAKEYISERIGGDYFVGRSWSGEELGAHECIRPTRPIDSDDLRNLLNTGLLQLAIRVTPNHLRVYDLIFRRFIASQMKSAKVTKERFKLSIYLNNEEVHSEEFERISKIDEPGFTRVWSYPEGRVSQELNLDRGEYEIINVDYIKKVSRTQPLREGDIIDLMRNRGIGRPSTYAKIIDVILKRHYAIVVGKRARFVVPTTLGRQVYDYLTKKNSKFSDLVSEERTRMVENYMDDIENGKREYADVLNELFDEAVSKGVLRGNVID